MPSDETEQYDGPKTTVQRDDSSGDGGENKAQIVKPAPMTLESLAQVTSVPAATCTFIGPVEPEYAALPILMKS